MEPTIRASQPSTGTMPPPMVFRGPAVPVRPRVQSPVVKATAAAEAAAAQAVKAPRWAVAAVKGCVAGILVLPLGAPALLAASDAFLQASAAETFRMAGSPVAVVLWLGLVAAAHALIGRYPRRG